MLTFAQATALELQHAEQLIKATDNYVEAREALLEYVACTDPIHMSKFEAMNARISDCYTVMRARNELLQSLRYDLRAGIYDSTDERYEDLVLCNCGQPERCSYCASKTEDHS
jgi:hypothetical protein